MFCGSNVSTTQIGSAIFHLRVVSIVTVLVPGQNFCDILLIMPEKYQITMFGIKPWLVIPSPIPQTVENHQISA